MAQTPYLTILDYNKALAEEILTAVPFGLQNFPSSVVLSTGNGQEELGRLIVEAEYGLVLSFGIDNSDEQNRKFTVSFLALDNNKKIICSHILGHVDGEESWDPTSVSNFPETVDKFDSGNC
jgi:hypothetical protein